MIETKEQMWEYIRKNNPALKSGRVTLPAEQLERLVHVVWQRCELITNRKRPADLFGQMFGGGR
jgi:hypothetical protein